MVRRDKRIDGESPPFSLLQMRGKARYKPRLKHPTKVHVWAGISTRGATGVCIFNGIMDAQMYTSILERICFLSFGMFILPDIDS